MNQFSVGQKVSFVRTVGYGSGFRMTTTRGKITALGYDRAWVQIGGGHKHLVALSALSPDGQNRNFERFLSDAVKAADPETAAELSGLADQVKSSEAS